MTTELHVFISSRMQELAPERQALHALLPMLGGDLVTLRPWVFEDDAPAADRPIRDVYLDALKASALYIGVFWNEYGEWTVDEFQYATQWAIDRHIYVKDVRADQRDPRLKAFLEAQSDVISGITPKWFRSVEDLCAQVRQSVAVWLQDRLARRPGATSAILVESSDDVPHLPGRLVGRGEAQRRARALLDDGGRVLLQGFSGMGKSALAATLVADWVDDGKGAVLWLHTGGEKAEVTLQALARPLDGYQTVANAAEADRLKAMRRLLEESGVSLVVLDDVWDGPALHQVLKAVPRRTPVLVTSQHRYALDQIIEVGKLPPSEALTLLSYYAGEDCAQDEEAVELARQLGYHAFALEVAGKTLKVDHISARELLKRIAAAPHALAMPGAFAEEGRTSITELLNASLFALDEDARAVFLAFGVLFAPGATPELIARCMGRDETAVAEALTTLQRRGLAERGPQKVYRVHDLAFSYARTIAAQGDRDRNPAVVACRAYTLAHQADPEALEAELGNLLGAADYAREHGDELTLIEMISALAGPYLSARGHTPAFLRLLDAAIAAAEALGAEHGLARHFLLGKRGNTFYDRGDLSNALRCYQGALDLAREFGLRDRQALLLCALGKVRVDQGADDAASSFDQAEQIARELNDGYLRAFVLEHQGYHAQARRDYATARRCFAEEAALAGQMGDDEAHFFALLNLGSAEHELGEFAAALAHHQRALEIAQGQDNRIWQAHARQSMGEDYHRLGDRSQAERCFAEALALFREGGMHAKSHEVEAYMETAGYPLE